MSIPLLLRVTSQKHLATRMINNPNPEYILAHKLKAEKLKGALDTVT